MNFYNLYFLKEQLITKEHDRVRSPETHLLFELTNRITGLCENKKAENYLKIR